MSMLANWLWQGCVVTAAAAALLRLLPRVSATTRYRIWWMTLLLVLSLPAVPLLVEFPLAIAVAPVTTPAAPTIDVPLPALPWWPAALLSTLWLGWAIVALSRTIVAFVRLRRAKAASLAFPVAREGRLRHWMALRGTGRRVRLVISGDVRAAAVLGLSAPAIAVAPVVLDALDDRELDQVLVHEWAHVQRRDDVARLVQLVVRAVAGCHPAVWWIDRELHIERESACDDWAVNLTGSARAYAACLTKLAALPPQSLDASLPAALSSDLRTRIVRLLERDRNRSTRRTIAASAFVAPALVAVAIAVGGIRLVAAPSTPSSASVTGDVNLPAATPSPSSTSPAVRLTVLEPARRVSASDLDAGVSARPLAITPDVPAQTTAPSVATPTVRTPPTAPLNEPRPSMPTASPLPAVATEPVLGELPGTRTSVPDAAIDARSEGTSAKTVTPWGAAADAGVAVGRGSQKAATATAGFFTRLSKSIAGSF